MWRPLAPRAKLTGGGGCVSWSGKKFNGEAKGQSVAFRIAATEVEISDAELAWPDFEFPDEINQLWIRSRRPHREGNGFVGAVLRRLGAQLVELGQMNAAERFDLEKI